MKAAVLRSFREPLEVINVPTPEPGAGQVLVRVRACGMCHSDLRILEGAIPTVRLPRIPGHEAAGEVVQCGPGVEGFSSGQAVSIRVDIVCGRCRFCRTGRTNLCISLERLGFEADGGYAEYIVVPADNLVALPGHISYPEAAVLADAIGTMYHAHRRLGTAAGDRVVILGAGGLGMHGIQLLRWVGATVLVTSRQDRRLEFAQTMGADRCVNTSREDLSRAVWEFTDGQGADAVFDTIGISSSVQLGLDLVRPGGKVAVIGYLDPTFEIKFGTFFIKEKEVIGCRSCTAQELVELGRLLGEGRIKPIVSGQVPLEQVNEGLAQVSAGDVIGRTVLLPQD